MFDYWKKNHDEVVVRGLDDETVKKFKEISNKTFSIKEQQEMAMDHFMNKIMEINEENKKLWESVYKKYQLSEKDRFRVDTKAKEIIRVADES